MGNYETQLFGDGVSTTRVKDVSNHYGTRESGGTKGIVKTEGSYNEYVIDFDGAEALAGVFVLQTDIVLPAGSIVEDVYVEIKEAFTITSGASNTFNIGTFTTENTNGFEITEAQAEVVGTYDVTSTLQGTWAAPLAASTIIGIDDDGGGTIATSGRAKVLINVWSPGA